LIGGNVLLDRKVVREFLDEEFKGTKTQRIKQDKNNESDE